MNVIRTHWQTATTALKAAYALSIATFFAALGAITYLWYVAVMAWMDVIVRTTLLG
ncbi:hypothetical protein ACODT5_28785 [Streptomyces sp. 5.8]|uniref:hypothetical protein n=1 Tax=Streptomyces sp. 5.8 TaxID=3406571 RepID=UPI003BB512A6